MTQIEPGSGPQIPYARAANGGNADDAESLTGWIEAAGTFAGVGNPAFGPVTVTPAQQQYPDLVRGLNQRYIGHPEEVRLVDSTEQVVRAVQDAVHAGKRLSVRSGGHCLEDFVYHPDVQVVIDVSRLNGVYYDAVRRAVAVESGATLYSVYERLYKVWGVTIPAGICYSVGVGGHVTGGGWGMLCRQFGLVVDHLYAVEVVVVDAAGRARSVVATREPDDPNRELWWAHTGGGGGNFGVVTRFWFRSPGATGRTPAALLPKPPKTVLLSGIAWPWNELSREEFAKLIKNYGAWHVANSAPENPNRALCSTMLLNHVSNGQIGLVTQVDASAPNAEGILRDYLTAINAGIQVEHGAITTDMGEHTAMPQFATPRELPWLEATRYLGTASSFLNDPTLRADYKSSYMRDNFTDGHVAALYEHLNSPDINNPSASVTVSSFGGQVNAVPENATASAHRDSAFKLLWQVMWTDPADDAKYLGWIRKSYHKTYADTGGVPVPNAVTGGCYVNYPDDDLGDPVFNRSTVPWHDLYYKGNYPRLQRIKREWDPRGVFRHSQSIRPAGE
ncbi:FAD-binding oxidoreductase [Saccharopolyspora phatthalungensis]|uniref:FAD-binding PCMH-type domain-containing protein n=1 Tax=Saccharopolyspora phatthalungensis TaxID=664693 RepID=A0A840QDK3_9PSEU|nr:FAD-binding protein [Saccharopolyspora phatthalungensis]MBB5158001.1 hypothetical protein [Saccharopolyspora phatthalungensis]